MNVFCGMYEFEVSHLPLPRNYGANSNYGASLLNSRNPRLHLFARLGSALLRAQGSARARFDRGEPGLAAERAARRLRHPQLAPRRLVVSGLGEEGGKVAI